MLVAVADLEAAAEGDSEAAAVAEPDSRALAVPVAVPAADTEPAVDCEVWAVGDPAALGELDTRALADADAEADADTVAQARAGGYAAGPATRFVTARTLLRPESLM